MVELEDASPIGVGRRTRDAAEPGAGPAGHAAIEKARPAHLVGMLVQIEKLLAKSTSPRGRHTADADVFLLVHQVAWGTASAMEAFFATGAKAATASQDVSLA